jgi:hypothetical protein
MFDVPVDAWYVWLGLSLASVSLLAVGAALPAQPPPDATDVADTVDRVAATTYPSNAAHPTAARAMRVGRRRLALRNDAGTTHAVFAFGPVTPASSASALHAVLRGAPPQSRFDSGTGFCDAAATARTRTPRWQRVDEPLLVRHVRWEGCDVTLVG